MRIGSYEVLHELGQGGMGRVRVARAADGRLVVLKNALRSDPDDDERLRDEARVGRRLRHPGVVETVELLEIPDESGRPRPVLVTAFVAGVSFLDLRRSGPLPPALVARLGRQLASALDAIHGIVDEDGRPLGVLHRDVTAGNCLLGDDGDARLIDFGIARSRESRALRTQTGLVRGTLRYLAPEIFAGGTYSVQSDLWSLGVVLFEALVGRAAVDGNDVAAMGRICVGNLTDLRPGETPDPRVLRAVGQLLQRASAERPRSAREAAALFAMLEKALDKEAGTGTAALQATDAVRRARARHGAPARAGLPARSGLVGGASSDAIDEETSAEFASAGIDVAVEPPFSHLAPTHAETPTPRLGARPLIAAEAPRNVVDDLRAYAASLAAMDKQLDQAEQASLVAEQAQRDRRASLQDTALWAPPAGVRADLAAVAAPDAAFRTPPETMIVPPTDAPRESPSSLSPPPPSSPLRGSLARVDTASIDRMLDAFLQEEETPTPSLSPVRQLQVLEQFTGPTAPTPSQLPVLHETRRVLRAAAVGIVVASVVIVVAALIVRGWWR
jgi:serine/threonine protein kinase